MKSEEQNCFCSELCRRLWRESPTENTPIIMLTAKAAETDKIAGLELGAGDYIVKPSLVKKLIARKRRNGFEFGDC